MIRATREPTPKRPKVILSLSPPRNKVLVSTARGKALIKSTLGTPFTSLRLEIRSY